jgi:hypothetical protein
MLADVFIVYLNYDYGMLRLPVQEKGLVVEVTGQQGGGGYLLPLGTWFHLWYSEKSLFFKLFNEILTEGIELITIRYLNAFLIRILSLYN